MKNRKFLIGLVIVTLFSVVLVITFVSRSAQQKNTVNITNLESCTKNINTEVKKSISKDLYAAIISANEYNKRHSSDTYTATVRQNSCKQVENETKGYSGALQTVYTTTFTADIPGGKQSWKLTFDWVTNKDSIDTDLGHLKTECLPVSELKFGDFKCENIVTLRQYGTDKPDPILQYMPYTGAGFAMEYNADTKTVTVNFDPPTDIKDIPAFIQNTKEVMPYWFQKRGLDMSKYKVEYSSDIDSSDDNQT